MCEQCGERYPPSSCSVEWCPSANTEPSPAVVGQLTFPPSPLPAQVGQPSLPPSLPTLVTHTLPLLLPPAGLPTRGMQRTTGHRMRPQVPYWMHSRQVWRSVERVWCDPGVESREGTSQRFLCACMLQRAGQDSELTSHTFSHPSTTQGITFP